MISDTNKRQLLSQTVVILVIIHFLLSSILQVCDMFVTHLLLTSRLRSYFFQTTSNRLLIDMALSQYFRLQQSQVAFFEVNCNRAGNVLTLV